MWFSRRPSSYLPVKDGLHTKWDSLAALGLCDTCWILQRMSSSAQVRGRHNSFDWRHNVCDGVSNHSIVIVIVIVTGLCEANPMVTKWPITRKMFPFDDVIMWCDPDNCMIEANPMVTKWPITRKMFPFDDVIMWCDPDNCMIMVPIRAPIDKELWRWIYGDGYIWGFWTISLDWILKNFFSIRS